MGAVGVAVDGDADGTSIHVAHCNRHRPHPARNLRPPDCDDSITAPVTDLAAARIQRREVLGGLIHEYERAA
jgi:putative transposase